MKKSNLLKAIIESTSIVSLLWWVAISMAPPTLAQSDPDLSYNGAKIYKDAKNNIYFIPQPRWGTTVEYKNVQISKNTTSDTCGLTKVAFSSNSSTFPTTVSFNSGSDTISSIAEVPKNSYKCVNGAPVWKNIPAQTSVFQVVTRNGGTVLSRTIYYPASRTGGASKHGVVAYSAGIRKKYKLNDCGFAYVSGVANSSKRTSSQLSIDDDDIDLATLPLNPTPPTCFGRKLYQGSLVAPTLNGSSIYRTGKAIYLVGLTPNSLNTVNYSKSETNTLALDDPSCGLFAMKLDPALTTIKIDGVETAVPTNNVDFDCRYKTLLPPANTLVRYSGQRYYYRTSNLNKKTLAITTEVTGKVSKKIPVNKCGFAVIPIVNTSKGKGGSSEYGGKVSINGSALYKIDSLPLANSDIKCVGNVAYKSAAFGVAIGLPPTDVVPSSVRADAPPPPEPDPPEEEEI
jgi:hypothetical protein